MSTINPNLYAEFIKFKEKQEHILIKILELIKDTNTEHNKEITMIAEMIRDICLMLTELVALLKGEEIKIESEKYQSAEMYESVARMYI